METSPATVTTSHRLQQQQQQPSSFNIRGLSGSGSGNGLSIRGEAGPSIVLISNLDPGANAEDVKVGKQYMEREKGLIVLYFIDGMFTIWQSISY